MKKWLRTHVNRRMIRPIIYKTTSRFMYLLTFALLWDHFLNKSPTGLSTMFLLIFFGFVTAAWIAHLRMKGLHLPKLPDKILKLKKAPEISFGDMIDHVDEPIVTFSDLEEEEQDASLVVADLACGFLFMIASFVVFK